MLTKMIAATAAVMLGTAAVAMAAAPQQQRYEYRRMMVRPRADNTSMSFARVERAPERAPYALTGVGAERGQRADRPGGWRRHAQPNTLIVHGHRTR